MKPKIAITSCIVCTFFKSYKTTTLRTLFSEEIIHEVGYTEKPIAPTYSCMRGSTVL